MPRKESLGMIGVAITLAAFWVAVLRLLVELAGHPPPPGASLLLFVGLTLFIFLVMAMMRASWTADN